MPAPYSNEKPDPIYHLVFEAPKDLFRAVTGIDLSEEKKPVNVMIDTAIAYGEAINSAIEQQQAHDEEMRMQEQSMSDPEVDYDFEDDNEWQGDYWKFDGDADIEIDF